MQLKLTESNQSPNHVRRRRSARLTACALAIGLGLATLYSPLAASAQSGSDSDAAAVSDAPSSTPSPAPTPTPDALELTPTELTDEPLATNGAAEATEPAANVEISPQSVPVPPSGSAVITIKVGGDRLPNGTVQGLPGVQLALYGSGTATTGGGYGNGQETRPPVQGSMGARHNAGWSWTTCVSDADGDCSFIIPIRAGTISATGVPQDTRFWVVQESGPAGWYSNPQLRVGDSSASPDALWQYRFRTDTQLRAGVTYRSTTAMPWNDPDDLGTGSGDPDRYFMRQRVDTNTEGWFPSNLSRTTGVWNQSRANPVFPASCTLDIALIADTSGSLGATGMAEMKTLMSSFVDSFRGTPTRMGLFSFSNVSPGSAATNNPALLPVTTATQSAAFKAQYAGWASGGGTNWDAGFATAASADPHYDVAILLTDGNPTVMRNNPGVGSSAYNSLQDIDAGIFSANQLKAEGTRVIAVGVGPGLTVSSERNLRAVSGPTLNSDYYRAASFDQATAALTALANKNCQGSIGVQKMIVPSGGTIADATPAPAGWQFDATSAAPTAVSVNSPTTQITTADSNGKVDFGLTFPGATNTGAVQIVETQQAGYQLVPVGAGTAARNAVCVNAETGESVSVTNAGTQEQPGFTVNGLKNQRVECTIYNRAPAPGELLVEKTSNPPSGATVTAGESVTYTLTFSNIGGLPVAVDHEDVLTDVLDDADLEGTITAGAPLSASLKADRLHITGTLDAGTSSTVTYTVRIKDPLPSTANAVLTNVVVPTGEQPPATCEPDQPCTVHPVKVVLSWNKVNAVGDRLSGSEWLLTPYTSAGVVDSANAIAVTDCIAATTAECTGADADPLAGQFRLTGLTPGSYQLKEVKAPAGYMLLTVTIDVDANTNISLGDIENEQIEIPGIPLTGGMGSLMFVVIAGALSALAAAAFWGQQRRNRKATTA